MKNHFVLITTVVSLLLGGCSTTNEIRFEERPNEADFAPVPVEAMTRPEPTAGSIYAANYSRQIYSDRSGYRVGDVIRVILDERTVAQKSAQTNASRGTDVDLQAPTLGGNELRVLGNPLSASINGDRNFSGTGAANQSNSLQGSISVTVSDVLPNGVLRVRGEKWITLTRGEEFLRLSGLLRPQDIGLNNTVSSSHLADARIAYSGTGELAENTRQGWLTRALNSAWFPF